MIGGSTDTQANEKPENRQLRSIAFTTNDLFPDCVLLRLTGVLTFSNQIEIVTTLVFDNMWDDIIESRRLLPNLKWRVRFGTRSGELCFRLHNVRSDPADRSFQIKLLCGLEVKQKITVGVDSVSTFEKGSGAEAVLENGKLRGSILLRSGANKKRTNRKSTEQEVEVNMVQIHAKGNEYSPKWSFVLTTEGVLQGSLINESLASMTIVDSPFRIEAVYRASINDIVVLDIDGEKYIESSEKAQFAIRRRIQKEIYRLTKRGFSNAEVCYDF